MPILKQSSNAHTKKRPRIDREMISAPMGDFRHTMHVGRGGDAFGDTSFLSNHGPSPALLHEQPEARKNGSPGVGSLSQLSQSSGFASGAGSIASSPANSGSSMEDNLAIWNTGSNGSKTAQMDGVDWISPGDDCGLKHAESILSFHLDLGPSILDEVLGVMDKKEPDSEWSQTKGGLYCFDYKLSSGAASTERETSSRASPELLPPPQHNLAMPGGRAPRDSTSSATSAYEGDSEEVKHSAVYDGVHVSQEQSVPTSCHTEAEEIQEEEEEEEGGQSYTFDDTDDEIGL
ncbi:cdc42 effector protein 5 [Microcaecilia unicolor]|uniref:Cdc42 effector protein 5 n=1 Tax=Microcaecilia unicolor TaxID=1415580 RepID=A0A6P7XTJ4_9AMPH|nr:cdc42 effector protein 5 [Microcaecilia unicolor]